jgi:2-dehydro-3-deoxyphosphogluconate aldolase / (4S)-4-hydroxy-2-oxoglutarate aldolase
MTGSILDLSPVMPVVVMESAADAVPVAEALLVGGVRVIEVTLRTDAALDAVREIAAALPAMTVGAGTVCTPAQVKLAVEAGAQFLVSPGATDRLLDAMGETGLPYLCGTANPSDMLRILERGVTEAKFFPATAVGGIPLLRAVYGPLPQLRFCPTGGITPESAPAFLALPNVGCVGGTWLTPKALVDAKDWAGIQALAAGLSKLSPGSP